MLAVCWAALMSAVVRSHWICWCTAAGVLSGQSSSALQVAAEHQRTLVYGPEVLDFLVGKVRAHLVCFSQQQGQAATNCGSAFIAVPPCLLRNKLHSIHASDSGFGQTRKRPVKPAACRWSLTAHMPLRAGGKQTRSSRGMSPEPCACGQPSKRLRWLRSGLICAVLPRPVCVVLHCSAAGCAASCGKHHLACHQSPAPVGRKCSL